MNAVPRDQRVHALDAMMLLCKIVQGGGPGTRDVVARVQGRLPDADDAMVKAWVLRELDLGGYYTNRTAFGQLAEALGPETYQEALALLEAHVERTNFGVGSASWWALKRLGHEDRAEAAAKRREVREREHADPSPDPDSDE